ncbi:hypothetical protein [Streptomyces sp. Da 82-17]|uniref:hypothetical protein n=1 Tax=Streptomyces sp. Da 82-17 TaxID=3377116 RepID=UPI0038D4BB07
MNFQVNPVDIDGYGKMVRRAHEDMSRGSQHLRSKANLRTSAVAELWQTVVNDHDEYVDSGERILQAYSTALSASSDELLRTATYYRLTDEQEAASHDSTYRSSAGAPATAGVSAIQQGMSPFGNGVSFTDRADASEALTAPNPDAPKTTYDRFKEADAAMKDRFGFAGEAVIAIRDAAMPLPMDRVAKVLGPRIDAFANADGPLGVLEATVSTVLDVTSPSVMMNEGLKLAFDFDLFDWIAQNFVGDWGTFKECAEVWRQVAAMCSAVATNISYGNDLLTNTWQGNAANVTWDYFDGLAETIREAEKSFETLFSCYEQVAEQVGGLVNQTKALLSIILDLAIMAGVEAAAGAAAAPTGVGLVLTAAAVASIGLKVAKMIKCWDEICILLNGVYLTLQTIHASGKSEVDQRLSAIKSFPLPASYDHPHEQV